MTQAEAFRAWCDQQLDTTDSGKRFAGAFAAGWDAALREAIQIATATCDHQPFHACGRQIASELEARR